MAVTEADGAYTDVRPEEDMGDWKLGNTTQHFGEERGLFFLEYTPGFGKDEGVPQPAMPLVQVQ